MEKLAEQITLARKRKRMTQKALADKAGISTQQLSNVENFQNTSVSTLRKILDVLELDLKIVEKEVINELNY